MFGIPLLILFLNYCQAPVHVHEGAVCVTDSDFVSGICTNFNNCSYAIELIKKDPGKQPKLCGFNGTTPIVCCPKIFNINLKPGARSTLMCQKLYNPGFSQWYHTTLRKLHPNQIFADAAGASFVKYMEFPHMVAVGFLKEKNEKKWLCGGSLITGNIVLTAAHCGNSRYGPPKYIRVGDLDLRETLPGVDYEEAEVEDVILYPSYNPSEFYHDIGLLKLKSGLLNIIKPICLHTQKTLEILRSGEIATAAGWGRTEINPQNSRLLKVDVPIIDYSKCAKIYENVSGNALSAGIVDELQICAGASGKDTCAGDSGGPLHVKVNKSSVGEHYFVIVGITSFGKGCGIQDAAGIYTRVAAYTKWIEEVIWANDAIFMRDLGISEDFLPYLSELDF